MLLAFSFGRKKEKKQALSTSFVLKKQNCVPKSQISHNNISSSKKHKKPREQGSTGTSTHECTLYMTVWKLPVSKHGYRGFFVLFGADEES